VTAAPPADAQYGDDLRVARVHLRLGQLTLARAELEDLWRQDALDVDGVAALAEARWRTGDAAAAAHAAFTHLDAGGSDEVAICIAAEATAAEGRPSEARQLMDRLPLADATTLDALFAGMPRRAFWPAGPVDRSDLDELRRGAGVRGSPTQRPALAATGAGTDVPSDMRAIPGPREVIAAIGETQAYPAPTAAASPARPRRVRGQLEPAAEVERAREELGTRPERALLRLSLVLRHDPTYAPVVLEILHLRREPTAALVRGDAQRLLGRHLEAEAAFDAAAESLEVS
jgi:hypothetical protein